MTWWRGESQYEVFFNRDELKTRARAIPPQAQHTAQGVEFLAPTDPDAGGTWMLVNEHGLTVCLLNRWHEEPVVDRGKSRGQLVLGMAGLTNTRQVMDNLLKIDGSPYKPFTLVAIDQGGVQIMAWNGVELFTQKPTQPLTSSSYCYNDVKKARCTAYGRLLDMNPTSLSTYQAGEPEASAFTVRMNRPDAQTWSRSRIRVSPGEIIWEYLEEMPGLGGESVRHDSGIIQR